MIKQLGTHPRPIQLMHHFQVGMDRQVRFIPGKHETYLNDIRVNLGAGKKHPDGFTPLDIENGWRAGRNMPFEDETVTEFIAYHFLEHLAKNVILKVLREVERCLKPGGTFTAVTPHFSSEIAHQDLDHKSTWTESTWRNLLENQYYEGTMPRDWRLKEVQSIIMGLNQRNLVVVSQLERI